MTSTFFLIELRKLKGTLAALLCLVAPTLAAGMAVLIAARQPQADWRALLVNAQGLWAYFMLPMTVTALSALMAQIEHGPRAWDHVYALPISRRAFLSAKAGVMMFVLLLMSLVLVLASALFGFLAGAVSPATAPEGAFPWTYALATGGAMWIASWLMAMIQLWVALRFRSFVAPLTLGLVGTFIVIAAMGAREAIVVPWVMPISVLTGRGGDPGLALALGGGGGLAALLLMIMHLSRREV